MNGLDLPGKLHAFLEGGLASLQNLVLDGVLDTGQEQLMLEEQGHVVNALCFGLVDGGAGKPDGGHGGRFVVGEAVVGNLDPAAIIIH